MVTLTKRWYDMANKVDYAYVAGIIDGEGSIQIDSWTDKKRWRCWRLVVRVCNCSTKMLDKLVGIFGGSYYTMKRNGNNFENRHVYYNWTLYGVKAYEMLKKIKPYLTEKKAQADVGIRFFIHQKRSGYRGGAKHGMSDFEVKKREAFRKRLKELRTAFLVPVARAETKREDTVMGEAIVQPD